MKTSRKKEILSRLPEKDQLAIEDFKGRLVEKLGDSLALIRLYGSKARGDWRRDSDIDILVVAESDNERQTESESYRAASETEEKLDFSVALSPTTYTLSKYRKYSAPPTSFLYMVNREGIDIWRNQKNFSQERTK